MERTRRAVLARVLGAMALGGFFLVPWLAKKTGAVCLAFCASRARATVATSALDALSSDAPKRADGVRAVLDREATVVFSIVALAGVAVALVPRGRWPRSGSVAAFVGACAVLAIVAAWSIPAHALGLEDEARLALVGGVLSAALLSLVACIAPPFRERVVPVSWPTLLILGCAAATWPGEAHWGVRAAIFPFALALAVEDGRPGRAHGVLAIVGLVIVASVAAIELVSRRALRPGVGTFVAFEGRDLRTLGSSDGDEMMRATVAIGGSFRDWRTPRLEPDGWSTLVSPDDFSEISLMPWRSRRLVLEGREVVVIFEGQPLFNSPGWSQGRVTLLDLDGNVVLREQFSTGYKTQIFDVAIAPVTTHGFPVLDVAQAYLWGPKIDGHQFYGLKQDRVLSLRFEGTDGRAARQWFDRGQYFVGPRLVLAPEALEAQLSSVDPVLVLNGLNYLAPVYERKDVTRLRGRASVQALIKAHTSSRDPWIREAALLALNANDDDMR